MPDEKGTKLLSVVVPVYNVKTEYLDECFKSILAQTFTDYELIIVNDGAPEDVTAFIDSYDYGKADVRIIRQTNMGVAAARNAGMDAATGEYITFVDSDDTIDSGCFAGITEYAAQNDLEVLMWGLYKDYGDHRERFSPYLQNIEHFSDKQKEEVQLKCLVGILPFYVCPPASADAAGSACAKLYRLDLLNRNSLRYIPGLRRAEDMEFNLRVMDKACNIGYLYEFFYNYRQIATSATYVYRDGGIEVFTDSLNAIHRHLVAAGKPELFFQVYYMRCMFFYLESMDNDYLNPDNPKPFRERIRQLGAKSYDEPYATAFANLKGEHLTFARKIPLFLIRHKMFTALACFYRTYRIFRKQ